MFINNNSHSLVSELLEAIKNKNYPLVAEFASNHTFSEQLLGHISQYRDMTAFNLLIDRIDIINKTDCFFQAGNYCAEIALALFKRYKDDFSKDTDIIEYDNCSPEASSRFDEFFIEESQLPRFYQPLQYQNNKETFAALLLNSFLNCDRVNNNMFPYLDYLLDNRKEFNIKDSDVVQILSEKTYDYDDYLVQNGMGNDKVKKQWVALIHYLVEKEINFKSDTQGYLIQIACFNEMAEQSLRTLIFNGSSAEGFLQRYEDSENWLTDDEENQLATEDYNNDRTYCLYKKFDTCGHEFEEDTIHLCQKLQKELKLMKLNAKLEQQLPVQPDRVSIGKIKI